MSDFQLNCPLPLQQYPRILLAHGGGGKLMQSLIENIFQPDYFSHDSTVVTLPNSKVAMTTDSYVINPLLFKGGDIGTLAVYGTINDLAMSGARPLYLTAGFIIEEGLVTETLWKIVQSMKKACTEVGVKIISGDTKVVERGKGDGLFINTAGVGVIEHSLEIHPRSIQKGDKILLSGDIGRHGISIMALREGLEFETTIESDCAPVDRPILDLISQKITIHCLRDLTRGGLASALNEISQVSRFQLNIESQAIPIPNDVNSACEILGLDALYIANEGRFIAFIPPEESEKALTILQKYDKKACIIGEVQNPLENRHYLVTITTSIDTTRILDWLSGDQLPRIC